VLKKTGHYSNLSVGSSEPGAKFLSLPGPSHPSSSNRRTTPIRHNLTQSRVSSRLSMVSDRSTSGPVASPSSRLFNPTFASRQRTTSLSSAASSKTPVKRSTTQPREYTVQRQHGAVSPTLSERSTHSGTLQSLPRSMSSHSYSSWSRAPRISFPANPHPLRSKSRSGKRKEYVANPRNKLDVAVGNVVNNLPVDIDIEVAEDSWQDQSGKYWIGTEDPKLCFCRILRSQTVMVRVGGGWQELSKFIQMHFADSFRILPDSKPQGLGSREETWISSSALLERPESMLTPPQPPKTPEPKAIPPFSLSTPTSGRSPQSLKSTSSPGSPLTPLQFLRRADLDSVGARPLTPSKGPMLRSRLALNGPPRPQAPVWKP